MSNSSLVAYTKLSPNHSGARTAKIDRVTIHCIVGQLSMATLGNVFAPTSRQASCNYGVCTDGIGMYVEEGNRSWCSSSNANDQRAITIETACDLTSPYKVTDAVMESLITLLVDIVKRNPGFGGKLIWRNDTNNPGNMTVHRWFSNTACPGDYLMSKMGWIADEVNKRLGQSTGTSTGSSTGGSSSTSKKSIETIAREVIAGAWGNGDTRKSKLAAAGYNYATVQAKVNELLGGASTSASTSKSIETIAREVIAGAWGNGDTRKAKLTAAGYNYATVQAKVNELLGGTSTSASTSKSIETIAREVIRGDWGNGDARKSKLAAAGYDYATVQAMVNKLLG